MKNDVNIIVSPQLIVTPWVEMTDGTRLQMGANHKKQALKLLNQDVPFITTGMEEYLRRFTNSVILSELEGTVTFIDMQYRVIGVTNKEKTGHMIYTFEQKFKVKVKEGQKVKPGDILAEQDSFLLCGKNLFTGIFDFYGWNYEDAILLSESGRNKLTHIEEFSETYVVGKDMALFPLDHTQSISPVLEVGQSVNVGECVLRMKEVSEKKIKDISSKPIEKYAPKNATCSGVVIYVNEYNKVFSEYTYFIKSYLRKIDKHVKTVNKRYKKFLSRSEINNILNDNSLYGKKKYKYKNEYIDLIVKYSFESVQKLNPGDKLSNRYGNKGVISKIMPDKEMLKLGGKPLEIIIDMSGTIKRMNIVPHLFETQLSGLANNIRQTFLNKPTKRTKNKLKKYVSWLVTSLDSTKTKWYTKQTLELFKTASDETLDEYFSTFNFICPSFESISGHNIVKVSEELKEAYFYSSKDPYSKEIINFVGGYMFWQKLQHLSEEKTAGRSVGIYNKKFLQPLQGKRLGGGQKFGEMEFWALISHNAIHNLREIIYVKSDDMRAKEEFLKKLLYNINRMPKNLQSNVSDILRIYLKTLSFDIKQKETLKEKEGANANT